MDHSSPSEAESVFSPAMLPSFSAPSSPPAAELDNDQMADETVDQQLVEQEESARTANDKKEARRIAAFRRRHKKRTMSPEERAAKARELDVLLSQTEAFGAALLKKTKVLGRVGSGFDNEALGEHSLEMATQPDLIVGGIMRDYQLEGLTWMMEICTQGLSGILADEMGLGKPSQP